MKKFRKVASFVAAFTMALAVVMPTVAKADVTVNVTKPADWNSVSVHAWDLETGDITTWPGIALTQKGDKYSVTIEADSSAKIALKLNDGGAGKQTTNIDGLTDTDGQGAGLAEGTYDVTIGTTQNGLSEYNWTLEKSGSTGSKTETTTTVAEATKAPTTSTPSTADSTQVVALAAIALMAGVSVVVFFRKRMAV
ncbi:MAG: starch-binding protein [Lachnospiraceae bacterium]|nr:starch-binding protein [Lachnospiraceae bacterium]